MISKKNDKAPMDNEKKEDPIVQEAEIKETADAGEAAQAEEDTAQTAEGTQGREVSETDILKAYVEQAIAEIKRLKGELEMKKKEADGAKTEALQIKGKLDSVNSEYENFRRRTQQEKENLSTDAVAKSVAALLPALDSLERAVQFSATNPET